MAKMASLHAELTTITEEDFYLTLNPVMLSKHEVNELKDLLNEVKKEEDNGDS
jgi:hypothetical protein